MTESSAEHTVIMTEDEMNAALDQLTDEIAGAHADDEAIYLLGILSRGRPLADRIASRLEAKGITVKTGSLSTTLYRDDLRTGKITPKLGSETHFDFDVDGQCVVLVDDVLNSGRTIRAALDEIMDYGRPARIQLACLIDRGLREVPIQADFLSRAIQTEADERVQVQLQEIDGNDQVVLMKKG